jgi:hypothetical protein
MNTLKPEPKSHERFLMALGCSSHVESQQAGLATMRSRDIKVPRKNKRIEELLSSTSFLWIDRLSNTHDEDKGAQKMGLRIGIES